MVGGGTLEGEAPLISFGLPLWVRVSILGHLVGPPDSISDPLKRRVFGALVTPYKIILNGGGDPFIDTNIIIS